MVSNGTINSREIYAENKEEQSRDDFDLLT